MTDTVTNWLKMAAGARLSRRVALWVFASVIAIEAVILVPSLTSRREELLAQLRQTALTQAALVMTMAGPDTVGQALVDHLYHLASQPNILGFALYGPDAALVGRSGDVPRTPAAFSGKPIAGVDDGSRIDVRFGEEGWLRGHVLVVRCDAAGVDKALWAYALRIVGLVVIISLVVTAGTLLALQPLVITPVLRLRAALVRAGESVQRNQLSLVFDTKGIGNQDEVADVAMAFQQMYRQIVDAIGQRQAAQVSLQQSLAQVNAFSQVLNKELEQGRQIQANFLPQQLPEVNGWDLAAFFRPARQVAGDFYDVFLLPDGKLGLVIADVCDKGVGAALFMALIRSLIRIFCGHAFEKLDHAVVGRIVEPACPLSEDGSWPASCRTLEAVRLTNAYILGNHGELGMFATLFFGVLDPASGTLDYINAGHEPPLMLKGNCIQARLLPCGPAIGLVENARFTVKRTLMEPGATLFAYTDGLSEARSPQDELFGRARLEAFFAERCFATTAELFARIQKALAAFTQNAAQEDDITLLALRRVQGSGGKQPRHDRRGTIATTA